MDVSTFSTREITLNELPQWSPWPARLLGLQEWQAPDRTVEKIDKEYDKDKYLRCKEFAEASNWNVSPMDVRAHELSLSTVESFCVSQKGKLYLVPAQKLLELNREVLLAALSPYMKRIDTVIEMGCGYGTNLWELAQVFPDKTYIGGEYSQNAVDLGNALYEKNDNISLKLCNFYDANHPILENCTSENILLFTRHAIEQLPNFQKVFSSFAQYFPRITYGIHLEVVQENYDASLLDLLRKSYITANDYNRDILSTIENHKGVELLQHDKDVFGINAFNPTTVLVWQPKT